MVIEWSNSKLDTFAKCGEKFRRRYIEKEGAPSTISAISGKAIHRVAAEINNRRMSVRDSLPKDLPREFVKVAMDQVIPKRSETLELADAALSTEVDSSPEKIRIPEAVKTDVLSGSVLYSEKFAPGVTPVGVEKHVKISTHDGTVVHGVIDLIDDTDIGIAIRDLKTTGRNPPSNVANKSQQLTFYTMLHYAATGTLPSASFLDYIIQDSSGNRISKTFRTSRSIADVSSVAERINTAIAAVNAGIFVPAPADSWWCDPRYCEFYNSCKYAQMKSK